MMRVELTGEKAAGRVALVDDQDYELVSQYKWFVGHRGYVMTNLPKAVKRTCIEMHRLVMRFPPGQNVDHRDGDKLNNLRENLRVCTVSENGFNRGPARHNTSGYKGVGFNKESVNRPWTAEIMANKKKKYLGGYATPQEAALAYNAAARELHGEFAYQNVV